MGRASIKENKNVYQLKREELGLSREKASELLECLKRLCSYHYWMKNKSDSEIMNIK